MGVSANTVRRWADSGRISCQRTPGGQRRFLLDDLETMVPQAARRGASELRSDGAEKRYQLLFETSLELASTLDIDEVLQSAARRLSAALQIPDCDIYRLDGDERMVCVAAALDGILDATWVGQEFRLQDWTSERLAVETRRAITVSSLDDARLNESERAVMRRYGQRSCVSLPLIARDQVIGLVDLLDHVEREFTDEEIATAEGVAQLVALALEHAQLYEEVKNLHLGNLRALSSALSRQGLLHPRPRHPRGSLHDASRWHAFHIAQRIRQVVHEFSKAVANNRESSFLLAYRDRTVHQDNGEAIHASECGASLRDQAVKLDPLRIPESVVTASVGHLSFRLPELEWFLESSYVRLTSRAGHSCHSRAPQRFIYQPSPVLSSLSPALPAASSRANVSGTAPIDKEAAPCRATSEGAHRQGRGSTSSTSAATAPSAARAAGSASGSNASPRSSVRPVAASCVRPRSAAARPRAALPAARTARRPSPASSPPWPSTPTCCPAASVCASSCSRSGCRRSRASVRRHDALRVIACWSSQHLVPQLGAVQLQSLNAAQINAHYARLLGEGRVHGYRRPLPQHRAPRPCRAASRPA